MNRLIVALIVLVCAIGVALANRCYECNGADCVNPQVDKQKDCGTQNNVCFKALASAGAPSTAQRGCGRWTGSTQVTIGDNQCSNSDISGISTSICNCNTGDYCNSADYKKISLTATGLSVIFAFLFSKLI